MMIVPAGVKVHLALGYTDMRKGMDGLAMLVRQSLDYSPPTAHQGTSSRIPVGRRAAFRVRKFLTCPAMPFVANSKLFLVRVYYHAQSAVVMMRDSHRIRHDDEVSVCGAEKFRR
jgi:hypothetical protein